MANNVISLFGVKYVIPYSRTTFAPYGIFRVIQEMRFERTIEQIALLGGDSAGAWETESGQPENALTGTFREYPNFAFSLLDGASITTATAESGGYASAIANKNGSSVVNATTGIDSVAIKVGSESALPMGRVVLVATAPTTVDVYVVGNLGENISFLDVNGKVAESITIPSTGGTVDIADIGITITGGSGTVAMTVGDTASFETRPVNNGSGTISVGGSSDAETFGLMLVFPKSANGKQRIVDFAKVRAQGMPFGATTREFSEWEFSGTPLVDTCNSDKLYTQYYLDPNTSC